MSNNVSVRRSKSKMKEIFVYFPFLRRVASNLLLAVISPQLHPSEPVVVVLSLASHTRSPRMEEYTHALFLS